jgi:hypothetical protein
MEDKDSFVTKFQRYSSEFSHYMLELAPNPDGASDNYADGAILIGFDGKNYETEEARISVPGQDLRAVGLMFLKAADIFDSAKTRG